MSSGNYEIEIKETDSIELVNKIYIKIQKYFYKAEKDNFILQLKDKFNDSTLLLIDKLDSIFHFVKLNIKEKKKYFTQSKYEIRSIDENIEKFYKSENFNQENFKNLIEKFKNLINTERQNSLQMEKLKSQIILLEADKKAVVEKTKNVMTDLKEDNLKLIDKIDRLTLVKERVDKEKNDLFRKTEEIHKKAQENHLLKNEIDKNKSMYLREKNRISIGKDKEIELLTIKLKEAVKFEKELEICKKENQKLKNVINELKVEVQQLTTEANKHYGETVKMKDINSVMSVTYKKYEKLCTDQKATINL